MQFYFQSAAHWVSENWLPLSFFAGLSLLGMVRSQRRRGDWAQVAQSLNLQWLGNTLPESLNLDGTCLSGSGLKVEEVVAGSIEGIHFIAFNVSERGEETRIDQTVVGFPMDAKLLCDKPPRDPTGSYRFELTGNWLLTWFPARQIAPAEPRDWCLEQYNFAARIVEESRTGSNEDGKLASRLFREF